MDSDDEFMSGLSSQDDQVQEDSDDGSLGEGIYSPAAPWWQGLIAGSR